MNRDESTLAILQPPGVVLAGPDQVERALASLWKPPPGEPDGPVAARVCTGNLIVLACSSDWTDLGEVLGELSPMHPGRTVAVLLDAIPAPPPSSGPSPARVFVSALCHVSQRSQPQVCCEQIVLDVGWPEVDDLVRTVRPLLEADVPTAAWWLLDPNAHADLLAAVRSMADRLILDAGLDGLRCLEPAGGCAVRELGWYRTYPWREQIASLFDAPASDSIDRIEQVEIAMAGTLPEDRVDAVWLAAFLAGQLGWQPLRRLDRERFLFAGSAGDVEVSLHTEAGALPGLVSLSVRAGDSHFGIARCGQAADEYRLTACDAHACEMPRCVDAPRLTRAQVLAAALAGRVVDAAFARAAPLARWMANQNP
ncbi:MAG TPA: glucose-6-phosphate dehydrogenase assembly protein OpcA [Phycisphaerae bacterium]|nr:glucose-6-phosphate dehydrogenase assembly protein OpcA [Phycisphaerae bacterium]